MKTGQRERGNPGVAHGRAHLVTQRISCEAIAMLGQRRDILCRALIPSVLVALVGNISISHAGEVNWWLGSYNTQYTGVNTAFIKNHSQAVSGILHCCTGPTILSNGTVVANDTLFRALTQPELSMKVPVMLPISPAVDAILKGTAVHGVDALVDVALRLGVDGYVVDYEPREQEDEAHAKLFAKFVKMLSIELHKKNLKLNLCVSSWGILKPRYYHLFADANCDRYISMGSTYSHQGPGNIEGIAYVEAMLAAFPKTSITVGIGSMVVPSCDKDGKFLTGDYKWEASSLTSFLAFLKRRGIESVAVWRTDIAALLYGQMDYCKNQAWLYPALEAFRNYTGGETELEDPPYISLDPIPTEWPVVMEVENFTVSPAGSLTVTNWGENHFYGATFSNTFASRKALLHASNTSEGTAKGSAIIGEAGDYYVAVRYEAAYRFETQFNVILRQNAATKLSKTYGARSSDKIWAFGWSKRNHDIGGCGLDPTPECHWTWGATENWVWEYYGPVQLSKGSVAVEINVQNSTSMPHLKSPLTDRNIDAVLFTRNLTDIKMRMANEQQLALDGLLTQHDEVFLKVTNHGSEDFALNVPFTAYHSAYPSQHLYCIPYCKASSDGKVYSSIATLVINATASSTTPKWVEVGSRMDSFNDGTWTLTAKPLKPPPGHHPPPPPFLPNFSIEFGVKAKGGIVSIGRFSNAKGSLNIQVAFDANTIATQRIRAADASLAEALSEARAAVVVSGRKPPTLTPIFGYSFCAKPVIRTIEPSCFLEASTSQTFKRDLADFLNMFPISDTSSGVPATSDLRRKRGYFEARSYISNLTKLEVELKNFSASGYADDILVVSLGDEISLSVPTNQTAAQALFTQWCSKQVGCIHGKYNTTFSGNPAMFWWSNLFSDAYGIQAMAGATKLLKKYLRNAHIGANYSPLTYRREGYVSSIYYYPVNKAINMFRQGGMTMPWGEDYTWQSPVGTQQMTTLLLDLFRAGVRGMSTRPQIMFYTMAHAPGNTATSWGRNFFGYLAHGMTFINLYEFRPCTASYTENYVDTGWGMYSTVRTALLELSTFEDIIQSGVVQSGDVGLFASEAFDIWGPSTPPNINGQHMNTFLSGKRSLYIALLHAELQVDVVVEGDVGPTLNSYKYIILADTHVSKSASAALSAWVKQGGHLVATAGAGMWDETNQTNTILMELLGVARNTAMIEPSNSAVQYIKQDLPYAVSLGNVVWNSTQSNTTVSSAIYGARHVFEPTSVATVVARFSDQGTRLGTAAAVSTQPGKGSTLYLSFLPGLSYFAPAIPARPTDRGSTDKAFSHFVPTGFDRNLLELLTKPFPSTYVRPIQCSNPLVHAKAVSSTRGVVIPLVNWSEEERIDGLNVTVHSTVAPTTMVPTMASGNKVTPITEHDPHDGSSMVYSIAFLEAADALILRHN